MQTHYLSYDNLILLPPLFLMSSSLEGRVSSWPQKTKDTYLVSVVMKQSLETMAKQWQQNMCPYFPYFKQGLVVWVGWRGMNSNLFLAAEVEGG